ncbi:MAG TPA: Gfo/Idh/MocA family oxidoreductase [Solirubrobacteraceae bacterium]|nr:Gfo/Idh/MocA family oxidoreductase [Solirubrobacteraceae bacterium]
MEEAGGSQAATLGVATRLGAAIVGAGFIGAVHARSARMAGARIAGVSASTPERSREAAERLGAERAYEDAESLVTAAEVDVVHLCTPNHLHAPLAEAALAAGKHVVCEKPLALDAEQAAALAAAADASGRVATVPFVYRYHAMAREARARIAAGELGALRLVHGGYLQDWLSTDEDDSWRVDPALGGASRAFADIGSHWCDLAEFVTGERIAAVCAQVATVVPERAHHGSARAFETGGNGNGSGRRAVTTEDLATVMFRTESGVLGSLLVSQVSPGRKNDLHLEIAGEQASVRFEQERPETLWVGRRERTEQLWRDATYLSPDAARHTIVPVGHPQGYLDCFDAFVADSYAAIAGDEPDGLPRFADGLRAARVTDAVLASAASGGWVDV